MDDYLNLKTVNCKNCYKCIRHCPVKSITFEHGHAEIIPGECILCGNCFVVCPQKAKEIRNDVKTAEGLVNSGAEVYASLAPSFAANYINEKTGGGFSLAAMTGALKKLGFAGVEETAVGATMVKRRYDEMVNSAVQDVIISSCCHSVNRLVQKYYPEVLPYLAHVVSPMQAHCMDIKRRYSGAKTVFIGPCVSKKAEAEYYAGFTDCVLTFGELSLWLADHSIMIEETPEETSDLGLARLFPVPGGILKTMKKANSDYTYLYVDGVDNCIAALGDIAGGGIKKCFIEMSLCAGSCTGGPVMNWGGTGRGERGNRPVRDYIAVSSYAGTRDFETGTYPEEALGKKFESLRGRRIQFGENAIVEALRKTGKTKPEHELNCGTCGYTTCRDKARAVLEGKADLFMCLPYLVEKAESFSDDIIKNTPNGIIVLNENLEVQQINAAACKMFGISPSNIMGEQIIRILDPAPFFEAVQEGKNAYNRRIYLPDYEKHLERTIIYDKSYRIIICIMRDITEETKRTESQEEFNRTTIELTDRVIEKQMRTVQEIASLLGETAAETKVALTKLKESVLRETKRDE
ncbi:MAG: PAS domain-containing protein [Treponema sp.]|jgi:PAS domain S-box-containing protein|nr:PAS domain-containing protein [Treponema sp.]